MYDSTLVYQDLLVVNHGKNVRWETCDIGYQADISYHFWKTFTRVCLHGYFRKKTARS